MDKKRILIFPAGTEIAFEIYNALKYTKFIELYGGTSTECHAEFLFENYIDGFPFIDDARFVEYLNEIVEKYKIDYIYPAHDSVCLELTKRSDEIAAKVITSPMETVDICRSKKKTYEFFKDETFIPLSYKSVEAISSYPVFIKPSVGQGAVGAQII